MEISETANYANYQAALATFTETPTPENGREVGRQLCLCEEQAGRDPGLLKSIRPRPAAYPESV